MVLLAAASGRGRAQAEAAGLLLVVVGPDEGRRKACAAPIDAAVAMAAMRSPALRPLPDAGRRRVCTMVAPCGLSVVVVVVCVSTYASASDE